MVVFTILLNTAYAQQSLITVANSMTTDQIWAALISPDANGETKFGKCRIGDATGGKCPSCACDYYFKGARLGSLGYNGWPKNPNSGDGTGCFKWKNGPIACWPGYPSNCSTSTAKDLAKAILLNALSQSPADVCGLPTKPAVKGSISISDTSRFIFVKPGEKCGQKPGEILCATIIGEAVAGMVQLTKFKDPLFCKRAYQLGRGANVTKAAKIVPCADFQKDLLNSDIIAEAQTVAGQAAMGFDLPTQAPFTEWAGFTNAQFLAMKTDDMALLYVSVGENSLKLPSVLQQFVISSNFNDTEEIRTASGKKYIIKAEIEAAKVRLAEIMKGTVPPKPIKIEDAVLSIKGMQSNLSNE